MAYVHVSVDIDAQDVLEQLLDEDLQRELDRRRKRRGDGVAGAISWDSTGLAEDLRAAFYARDASRFEALLRKLDHGNLPMRAKVAA